MFIIYCLAYSTCRSRRIKAQTIIFSPIGARNLVDITKVGPTNLSVTGFVLLIAGKLQYMMLEGLLCIPGHKRYFCKNAYMHTVRKIWWQCETLHC